MKKYIYLMGVLLAVGCNTTKHPTIEDYAFLAGKWHSIGSDTYEEWRVGQDSLISKTYVVKNDSTVLLDRSCIVNTHPLKMITHLNDPKKMSYEYLLEYNAEEKCWVFVNKKAFPQSLFYSFKENQQNIYAFVINNGKKIEFLYEAVK